MRTTDNANRDYVIKYLADKYGKNFAYGAGGNIDVESAGTFRPSIIQFGKVKDEAQYIADVDSGKISREEFVFCKFGNGLFQVTKDGKKGRFYDNAKAHGYSIGSMDANLSWFDAELPLTGYANVRKSIKENWSVEEVARIFCTEFERPRSMQMDAVTKENAIQERIRRALKLKELYEEEATEVVTPMAKNGMTICLDAGHYDEYNRSPVVPAYYESNFTWKFTNFEKEEYERLGFTVILTRSDKDKDLALDKRGKMSKGAVLFKSNHSNACGTESVDHPSVIIPVEYKGVDFEGCKVLGNRIGENCHKVMGTKQVAKVYFKDAGYDRNKNGKGGDDEYYGVMHGAQSVKCPRYMIVEHGFHTNRANATWLLNDENIKRLAISEAQVVAQFLLGLEPSDTHIDDVQPIGTITYVTKAGDTLSKIAKDYGVTVADIVALNGIANPNLIGKNVKLLIPATTSKIRYYTVKHRDTLSAIARDYTLKGHKVTYIEIAKANNIPFPYRDIHPGDTLIIP